MNCSMSLENGAMNHIKQTNTNIDLTTFSISPSKLNNYQDTNHFV